jgi:serine/alanine adding enzyme
MQLNINEKEDVLPKDDWDAFVESHPDSSFFHKFAWKQIIEKSYGFKAQFIYAKNNKGIQGILPLFEIRQITGKKLLSIPFSTEAGILYNNEEVKKELLNRARKLTDDHDLDYLEIRQEKYLGEGWDKKDYYYHLKLKLDRNPEVIWNNADQKMRNAVRKARKEGLTTDKGLKYFKDFYRIYSKNMRDLGTPVDNKEFFKQILRQFNRDVDIIVSKYNGKVIGAIFLLKHKKMIKSEWASSLRKYFGLNPNQLMYWRAIEDACRSGYDVFDFGRSMESDGTYLFKKKFGAKPTQLVYSYYMRKGEMPDTRKENKKRKAFVWFWKKTPVFLANLIGPKIRELFP